MSLKDMLQFMIKYEDVYVCCDVKEDVVPAYKSIIEQIYEMEAEELLDRLIASVYTFDDYEEVKKATHLPADQFVLRQYANNPHNYYELASFCIKNRIRAINIGEDYFAYDDLEDFSKLNIKMFVAVVDSLSLMRKYSNRVGFVSNYIYENDLKYITNK